MIKKKSVSFEETSSFRCLVGRIMARLLAAATSVLLILGAARAQEGANPELLIQNGRGHSIRSIAFSPDRRMLASAEKYGRTKLWEVSSGRFIRSFEHVSLSVAFSPDGKLLASGGEDFEIHLWEVSTGRPIHSFEGHSRAVVSTAFSPDGKLLASGSEDKTLKLWGSEHWPSYPLL